ncbi:MAG: DUF1273 domain-containing protein [Oscillospiraceae bacterium]|nr:DUF1273 domain-containing protein [Oscillospiraceae bacterium]
MKEKTACFTGHRQIPENEYDGIQKRLESEIINLINQGVRNFCAGGALGFDTMAALAVLSLKEKYPYVQLILILPCKEQTRGWTEADKKIYGQILLKADKAVYTSEHYYNGCMFTRNRAMVDNSGVCVCYLTSEKGGTAYTVNYAKQQGLRIINLAPSSSSAPPAVSS